MTIRDIPQKFIDMCECSFTEEIAGTDCFCQTFLVSSDARVLQHIREKLLNLPLTLSEDEYYALEECREACVEWLRANPDYVFDQGNEDVVIQ